MVNIWHISLPSYAIDDVGNKTYDVDLDMQEYSAGKFKATVAVDPNWLLNANRVYPIRIDPSIVHDETSDFSGGVFNKTTSVTGPKILIDTSTSSYWGEYISSINSLGSSMSTACSLGCLLVLIREMVRLHTVQQV